MGAHFRAGLLLRIWIGAQRGRLGDPAVYEAVRQAAALAPDVRERAALAPVAALRAALADDATPVSVVDFGAGSRRAVPGRPPAKPPVRTVAEIYRRAAVPPAWGLFLFGLVRALRPVRVLELGASLGVSAAYLQTALRLNEEEGASAGRLVTIEGDPTLAARAQAHLDALGAGAARVVEGAFRDRLPGVLDEEGPFDAVFIDGHHEAEAVRRYFERIEPALAPGGWVVLDDLEPWTTTVRRAWRAIGQDHPEAGCVDLVKLGLYFKPRAPKKSGGTQ